MLSLLGINDDCLNEIIARLDERSAKNFFALFKKVDPQRAESFLSRPEYWQVRIELDPDSQRKIQQAAYFPSLKGSGASLANSREIRQESSFAWPFSVFHRIFLTLTLN